MTMKELAQVIVRFIALFSVALLVRKSADYNDPRIGVSARQPDWLRIQPLCLAVFSPVAAVTC
jgi:hypothetical protein